MIRAIKEQTKSDAKGNLTLKGKHDGHKNRNATAFHAKQQRFLQAAEFHKQACFRNGIETIPVALRKRHRIDKMTVRGYIKTKLFFGFKVAGMNARKLIRYLSSQAKLAPYPQRA